MVSLGRIDATSNRSDTAVDCAHRILMTPSEVKTRIANNKACRRRDAQKGEMEETSRPIRIGEQNTTMWITRWITPPCSY